MKKIFLGFGILSFFGVAHAALPVIADFPFERDVQLPSFSAKEEVQLELDRDVLQSINDRFGNIALFDQQNASIEYGAFFQEFHRVKTAEVVAVSSEKGMSDSAAIIDDDVLTNFTFDERVDGRDASWVLLDLGEDVPLSRLEVFVPENAKIRSIGVEGGLTEDSLKPIISKRPLQQRIELSTDMMRFVKISFWGVQVKIDDIRITAGATGTLYFTTLPGKNIRLLYGGDVDRIIYTERISKKKKGTFPLAHMGRVTINKYFPVDKDEDGKDITEDNCPFVSNRSQSDSDGDRIGNACDNAVDVINSRQEDTDHDGIGNVIDNCKLVSNSDQADRDEDGWGDACDNAHEKDSAFWSGWIRIIGSGAIILLLLFGLWQVRRTKKLKK